MKTLCVVLLLALGTPGCSRFSKSGRMDRAYYKQLKQVRASRVKERQRIVKKQSQIPSPNTLPPLGQTVEPAPGNQ
jgi:hypothetical protein